MSRRRLAQRAGIGVELLAKLEQGQSRIPQIRTLAALAGPLGIAPADLIAATEIAQSDEQIAAIVARFPDSAASADCMCRLVQRVVWTEERVWDVERLLTGYVEYDRDHRPTTAPEEE